MLKCIPQAYWVNTGKNEIPEDVLRVATTDITERLYTLLSGESVIARIDQNVVYRSVAEDPANIYSLLPVSGYLKAQKKKLQADGVHKILKFGIAFSGKKVIIKSA